jgi:hypothetical protein
MITCCEVAIVLAVTNIISLAVFAGYTIHWKERTLKLEKKNGHEQAQINNLEKKLKHLEKKLLSND